MFKQVISFILLASSLWQVCGARETPAQWLIWAQHQTLVLGLRTSEASPQILYNNALGRSGEEWLLFAGGDLEVFGPDKETPEPKTKSVPEQARKLLEQSNQASAFWARKNKTDKRQALTIWHNLSRHDGPAVPGFRAYTLANAIAASVDLIDYDLAKTLIRRWQKEVPSDHPLTYKIHWLNARILYEQHHLDECKEALSIALKLVDERPQVGLDKAEMQSLLADVLLTTGDLDQAESLLRKARSLSSGDAYLTAHVIDNMGYLYVQKAQLAPLNKRSQFYRQAIEYELDAQRLLVGTSHKQKLAIIESNIASIYERLGDLQMAQRHYQRALNLAEASRARISQAVLSRNLGKITQYLGDYAKSAIFYQNAAKLYADASPLWSNRMLCEQGSSLRLQGQLQPALHAHQTCADYFSDTPESIDYAFAQVELAADHLQLGNISRAKTHLAHSSSLMEKHQDLDKRLRYLEVAARLASQSKDLAEMEKLLSVALNNATKARYPTRLLEMYDLASQLYLSNHKLDKAAHYAELASELALYMHRFLDPQHFGPAWSERTRNVLETQLALQFLHHPDHQSSDFIQRSIALIEQFRAINLSSYRLRREPASQVALDHPNTVSKAADRYAIVNDWQNQLALYQAQFLNTPLHEASETRHELYGLAQIQRHLQADQAMLYFVEGAKSLHALLISKTNAHWHEYAEPEKLIESVTELVQSASDPNSAITPAAATAGALLSPLLPVLKDKIHWLISPSYHLQSLPFALMQDSSGKAIVRSRRISYFNSASLYFARPQNRQPHARTAVVMADPSFGSQADDATTWTERLKKLPFSLHEAGYIKDALTDYDTTLYTGEQANRHTFFSEKTRHAAFLHIATHGHFQPETPDNLGLALSPQTDAQSPHSGFVAIDELYLHAFDNRLVVISGCETNRGKASSHEGSLSLGRAFLAQGASNVISTLWPVSDRASAEFMRHFYTHLNSTEDISESLRQAQLAMQRTPRYRHPFYWAAYTLYSVGNGQAENPPAP